MATKARIVRIGNSRGIRIPKILLDQAQLPDEVELHAEPGRLVVQGVRFQRRSGFVALDQLRTVDKERLLRRLGRLTPETIGLVLRRLQEMFAE